MDPILSTERLQLVWPSEEHLEFLYTMYCTPEMMHHLGGPLSKAKVEQRLTQWHEHWAKHGFGIGVVQLKDLNQPIGVSALFHTEIEGEKLLEIGWMIGPNHQQNGHAFEIAQGYLDFARDQAGAKSVTAFPNQENIPSNRICQKLGLIRRGPYAYKFYNGILNSVYWRIDF